MYLTFEFTGVILLSLVLCGIIGTAIGKKKGRVISGFFLGFVLGPIGVLIVAFRSEIKRPCPLCRKPVRYTATVCRHCNRYIPKGSGTPKLAAGFILITIIISGMLGFVAVSYLQEVNPKLLQAPIDKKECATKFEILKKDSFGEAVKITILVSPETPKAKVIDLANCLNNKHADRNIFNLLIYDDLDAYNNRDNANYPEKKYYQHFLCMLLVNRSLKHNELKWLAEERREPK